ncbi:unnamed protein product [Closterium sp. NIES-65]|nr:unnamed protein product [Closterium sp. NIES-65]
MRRNDVNAWRPANEFTSCCEEGDGAGRGGTHDSGADSYRGDAWCNGVGVGGKEGDEGRMSGRAREGGRDGEYSYEIDWTAFEAPLEQQEYASVATSSEGSAAGPQGCAWQRQQEGYASLPLHSQPDLERSYGKTETAFEAPQQQHGFGRWQQQGGYSALSTHSQPDFLHSYGETETAFEAPREQQQQRASGGTSFDTVESADGGGAPMAARHVAELSPSLHRHPEGWDAALMRTLEADPLGVHGGGMISAGVDGGGMNGAWVNCAGLNGAGMHGGGVDGGGMNGGCMQGASPPHTSPAELLSCASTSCLLHLRSLSPTPTPTHPSHPGLSLSPPPVVPPLSLTTSTAPAPAPLTPPLPCCPAATCPTHTPSHSVRSHSAPPVAPSHHVSHNAWDMGDLKALHEATFPIAYESEFYSSMVHHRGIISWGAVDPCQQQATPFIPNLPRTPFPFSPPSPPPPYSIRYESEFYSNVVHHRGIISWGAVDPCQPDRLVGFITARLVPPAEAQPGSSLRASCRLRRRRRSVARGGMEKKGEREEGGVGMVPLSHGAQWAPASLTGVGFITACLVPPGKAQVQCGKKGVGCAAWGCAAWGSAAWGSAAWGSAAWGGAAWGSAAWGSAAWGSAAWGSAAWGSAAWGSAAWGCAAYSISESIQKLAVLSAFPPLSLLAFTSPTRFSLIHFSLIHFSLIHFSLIHFSLTRSPSHSPPSLPPSPSQRADGADVLPLTPPSPLHTPSPSLLYILTLGVSKRYRKAGVASQLSIWPSFHRVPLLVPLHSQHPTWCISYLLLSTPPLSACYFKSFCHPSPPILPPASLLFPTASQLVHLLLSHASSPSLSAACLSPPPFPPTNCPSSSRPPSPTASHLVHLLLSHASFLPHCAAVYLHVVTYNAAAIRFYRSLRFCYRRRLSRFYYLEGGEYNALLFARYVNGWSPPDSLCGALRSQLQGPTLQLLQSAFTAASAVVSAAMFLVCRLFHATTLAAAISASLVTATEPPAARLTRCARCAQSRAHLLSSSLRTSSSPPPSSGCSKVAGRHGGEDMGAPLPQAPWGEWMLGTMALSIRPATTRATHPPLLPSCLGLQLAAAAGVIAAAWALQG